MLHPFSAATRGLLATGLLATTGLLTTACQKDDPTGTVVAADYSAIDEGLIKAYVASNNITTAQRQPSGLYFVPVVSNPAGTPATAKKRVSVLYTGRLLNGTVFDASSRNGGNPYPFVLGNREVIQGWDEGIALMRKGEKATLLIPSALGYGARAAGSIPPNSVLVFDVELTEVQ